MVLKQEEEWNCYMIWSSHIRQFCVFTNPSNVKWTQYFFVKKTASCSKNELAKFCVDHDMLALVLVLIEFCWDINANHLKWAKPLDNVIIPMFFSDTLCSNVLGIASISLPVRLFNHPRQKPIFQIFSLACDFFTKKNKWWLAYRPFI